MIRPLALAILALGGAALIQEKYPQEPVTEKATFRFNEAKPTLSADGLGLVSFGYSRMLSNLLWLRFLQASPVEKVPKDELSWIYYDLDAISTMDPDFYPVFEHAGIFLSVVTEDKRGAELILNKGVRLHPDRWRIHAHLAYHYQFELSDEEKADQFYFLGSKLPGAPPLLSILAAKSLAKSKSLAASIEFLENLKKVTSDERTKEMFEARIQKWKKKLRGTHERFGY